ncbi:hypothetical protein [Bacillus arachidis]|uniref:Phosphoribulokinase/uridine kinase domain-containing protein n=1 Tax=Bacillus arachidis TaxID=2819290 RepID=A0ABS3P635_9BACI|nr:hypothetical protein [Bacillus arachidis]MBO1628533.1 hypothetical protein [Bacillus arachidis]
MNGKPKIISIAAVSGGGKTTITNLLINKLSNSKALYFDNYEFNESPYDICKWVNEGADYNEWILTPLITDIQFLFNSSQPLDYILLDYPFAYLNNEMREYIDFTIYIDTPLDIAMARRILRDFNESLFDDVRDDLTNYLSRGRTAYLEMIKTVKPNSDIVIDGSLPTILIVNQILEEINKREL